LLRASLTLLNVQFIFGRVKVNFISQFSHLRDAGLLRSARCSLLTSRSIEIHLKQNSRASHVAASVQFTPGGRKLNAKWNGNVQFFRRPKMRQERSCAFIPWPSSNGTTGATTGGPSAETRTQHSNASSSHASSLAGLKIREQACANEIALAITAASAPIENVELKCFCSDVASFRPHFFNLLKNANFRA